MHCLMAAENEGAPRQPGFSAKPRFVLDLATEQAALVHGVGPCDPNPLHQDFQTTSQKPLRGVQFSNPIRPGAQDEDTAQSIEVRRGSVQPNPFLLVAGHNDTPSLEDPVHVIQQDSRGKVLNHLAVFDLGLPAVEGAAHETDPVPDQNHLQFGSQNLGVGGPADPRRERADLQRRRVAEDRLFQGEKVVAARGGRLVPPVKSFRSGP
mmetsp:Transcript_23113/g.40937  ORF Transcript_23113/g.40937 Transcript_23113/m.40937 type:complete len:208 (-) Transcript_23113:705-1328(-)